MGTGVSAKPSMPVAAANGGAALQHQRWPGWCPRRLQPQSCCRQSCLRGSGCVEAARAGIGIAARSRAAKPRSARRAGSRAVAPAAPAPPHPWPVLPSELLLPGRCPDQKQQAEWNNRPFGRALHIHQQWCRPRDEIDRRSQN